MKDREEGDEERRSGWRVYFFQATCHAGWEDELSGAGVALLEPVKLEANRRSKHKLPQAPMRTFKDGWLLACVD